MTTRRDVLSGGAGFAAALAFAARLDAVADPLAYSLKPERLAEGVWLIPGAQEAITRANGGAIANIVVLDTKAGSVIVDTGPSFRYGEALAACAKQLTGKPVARAYLTHFHPDHVLGNQAFASETLACTPGVADGLATMGNAFADSMYHVAGDWMRGTEVVVPGTILATNVEDFGDRRIRLLQMRGHTAADLVLFDERSGTLIAGDLVFLDRAPTTPHADIERWRINLANLGAIPGARLVPGHGPAEASDRGIRQTRDWLEMVQSQIRDAFERGLDIAEAVALPLPAWTEAIAVARYEYERTVMHLYAVLESERLPQVERRS